MFWFSTTGRFLTHKKLPKIAKTLMNVFYNIILFIYLLIIPKIMFLQT